MPNARVVKSNKRKRSQFFDDEAKEENVIRDSEEENEEQEHEEEREDFYETDAVPVEGNSASFYRRIDNGEATLLTVLRQSNFQKTTSSLRSPSCKQRLRKNAPN